MLKGAFWTVRPHQWVKNVFVLAPVVFAKEIFHPSLLLRAFGAFGVFCLLAGAVYTMNDLADVEADRQHPVKRFRPIAAGEVPLNVGRALGVVFLLLGVGGAAFGSVEFFVCAASYFALNIAYSFRLKNVPYLDVFVISLGFVLRVLAGGFGTLIDVSGYLIGCTALLALFLGFGKRRHEWAVAALGKVGGKKTRKVLELYSRHGLDVSLWFTSIATVGMYLAYTLDTVTVSFFQTQNLWWTSVFVVLGVWRFSHLVRHRPESESPTHEMLRDGPFVAVLLLWVMVVVWMVYRLEPSGT